MSKKKDLDKAIEGLEKRARESRKWWRKTESAKRRDSASGNDVADAKDRALMDQQKLERLKQIRDDYNRRGGQ